MIQPDNTKPQLFVLPDFEALPSSDHVSLAEVVTYLESPILLDMARDRLQRYQQAISDLSLLLDELSRRNK